MMLYIHIPFCTKKCDYCHFYVIPDKEPYKQQLVEGLKLEWQSYWPMIADKQIESVYFGGGTPSLIGPGPIQDILSWIPNLAPDAEITLEANPENATVKLMQDYANAGINRVSIGVQTLDDSLLKKLGRLHDGARAKEAVRNTAEAGIENISIDLMYDLPQQTLEIWEGTLDEVVKLPITHLSLYNLTIEPHTPFYKHRKQIESQVPDAETSLQMYETAIEKLTQAGLAQYEISAFAKEGCQSRHNVGYWTARPFLGLGPSAFSYWEGQRFRNVAHLNKYHAALIAGNSPVDFKEALDPKSRVRELLAIRIRLVEGIDLKDFPDLDVEGEEILQRLAHEGFLERSGTRFRLTRRGILFYDTVAVELI